jgi:hypothetical protein
MATMSIRGVDEQVLARLKHQAEQDGSSLNSLVVRLLQGDTDSTQKPSALKKFDDLDALAGTWSSPQARAFERATAPFSEVDPALWK